MTETLRIPPEFDDEIDKLWTRMRAEWKLYQPGTQEMPLIPVRRYNLREIMNHWTPDQILLGFRYYLQDSKNEFIRSRTYPPEWFLRPENAARMIEEALAKLAPLQEKISDSLREILERGSE